jgi:hypothetical protein
MNLSHVRQGGVVLFPAFTGERIYMHEFTCRAGLPPHLKRWQDTVDAMLDGIDAPGSIFLMVDQAQVGAGLPHRRGGPHVDGVWDPGIQAHGGGGGGGGDPLPGGHRHRDGGHRHLDEGRGDSRHRHGGGGRHCLGGSQTIVLAADVLGCEALVGPTYGSVGAGGDCSRMDLSGTIRVPMEAHRVWHGDALTMVHESLPMTKDCLRTTVRLNVRN